MNRFSLWWRVNSLASRNVDARLHAAERLGEAKDPRAIPALVERLGDEDARMRAAAAAALGAIGDARAVEPLVQLVLHEPVAAVRQEASDALRQIGGPTACQALASALDAEEEAVRQMAAAVLRRYAWEELSDAQRARVAIVSQDWEAAMRLGPAAVGLLAEVVRTGTAHTCRQAAEALGRMGGEAYAALKAILEEVELDERARQVAAWALREYAWPELDARQMAIAAIVSNEWTALPALGVAAVEPLWDVLQRGSREARLQAVEVLGRIRQRQALDALAAALRDGAQETPVREALATALARVADEGCIETLSAALEDESWAVRSAAAAGLERLGWKTHDERQRALLAVLQRDWDEAVSAGAAAIDPLLDALHMSSLRAEAARALARLGAPGADALLAVVNDRSQPIVVWEAAAAALSDAGDRRVTTALTVRLKDPDPAARQSASQLLERFRAQPADNPERAVPAPGAGIAIRPQDVAPLAFGSLIRLVREAGSPEARQAADLLEELLCERADRVALDDLLALMHLDKAGGATLGRSDPLDRARAGRPGNLERLCSLAHRELLRRGVSVSRGWTADRAPPHHA